MPRKVTPLKAIRTFCVHCSGNMVGVRTCDEKKCSLWRFRFGMSIKRYEKKKAWRISQKDAFCVDGKNGEENYGKK